MSSSKVKTFDRVLAIVSDVVTGTGPYTHTITTATHNLTTGDVVILSSQNAEFLYQQAAVTVTNATTFTVSLTLPTALTTNVTIPYYSGGMTGAQTAMPWPQATTPGVIQIVSTGAATVAIEGSLDNTNFVNLTTFTLGAAGTDYVVIDAAWAYVRANITSIAATKLAKIYRSV